MKIIIFCRCSLFPSWLGQGLISTPVQWLSRCEIYGSLKIQNFYKTTKIIELMLSWPVVVSRLCIHNIKTTNVSRNGYFVHIKNFESQVMQNPLESFNLSRRVTRDYSFGVKRLGSEADLSPHLLPRLRTIRATHLSPRIPP